MNNDYKDQNLKSSMLAFGVVVSIVAAIIIYLNIS
jgi:hypothetical protein